jgi:hypothetical protein
MGSGHHLSLSLSREMWNEMLSAALPFSLASGEFDLAQGARAAIKQLQVKERVVGLLEDRRTPQPLVRFSERARQAWSSRREGFYQRLNELVRVEGTWKVDLDEVGTEMRYGQQKVSADAFLRGVAEGQITFLNENISLPFQVEKRVGASVGLGRIRFSREEDAVIGNVQDLAVHLGDNAVLQLLSRAIEYGVEQQISAVKPVPVLKREQVSGLVGGMGSAMRMQMGVDDLQLDIAGDEMTLKVRFGFTPLPSDRQLEDQE